MSWQDISTAPRYKKVIVAYRNSYGIWRRVMARYWPEGELAAEEGDDEFAPAGWYEDCGSAETTYPVDGEPVLWHELPALPAQPATGGEL